MKANILTIKFVNSLSTIYISVKETWRKVTEAPDAAFCGMRYRRRSGLGIVTLTGFQEDGSYQAHQ